MIKVPIISDSEYEALVKATCLSKYAPDVIDGEIIEDNPKEIHIRLDRNNSGDALAGVYVLQKNAENYKFWDITDKINPYLSARDEIPEEEISDEERAEIHKIREEMESGKKSRLDDVMADRIYLMDLEQESFMVRKFPDFSPKTRIIGCSDQYERESRNLNRLIEYWAKKEGL